MLTISAEIYVLVNYTKHTEKNAEKGNFMRIIIYF
ncbi:MAG: hypothetical protein US68_C0001G0065 [Candidatus Shapirobacteria bacterium GW2011_GWE1_38_10]|uniref:Uncharacterized protein n=1 Tax=Candidatus Shapirobacteria bacterium GW2011_GWE1_38_10 TaxID=1618488 RepID=A0A0G0LDX4_9BACT|nr:MAG: hypothetical protein US46_C0004G0017 [Candidatus Shapirobacteria bacterium GW2011_GWF2_37_20]KKQ50866.1 MAG: hypothetical protein US68_C0001G0065 [Candidatus Shapirobacteria bacterium GW2011_GWE1_38_10]